MNRLPSRFSIIHITLLGTPPPQVFGPLAGEPVRGPGQRGARRALGGVLGGGGGQQGEQGLLAGPLPVRSCGDPQDERPERHEQEAQDVHERGLGGGVLILWVVPLKENEKSLLFFFLFFLLGSYFPFFFALLCFKIE